MNLFLDENQTELWRWSISTLSVFRLGAKTLGFQGRENDTKNGCSKILLFENGKGLF